MMTGIKHRTTAWLVVVALASGAMAMAQDKETGWFETAEFSLTMTGGNSEAQTLALRNTLRRVWQDGAFELSAGALRAETSTLSLSATGTATDFDIVENSTSAVTAENYFLRTRLEGALVDDYFWFAGAGWERNEFAGIANRYLLVAGVGTVWFERDEGHFKTEYGVTWTDQQDVVEDAGAGGSFGGLRLAWDLGRKMTATSEYTNVLVLDANIDDSDDYRADMINSLSASLSGRLSLKVSLQLLFDNRPALARIPLLARDGAAPNPGASVLAPLDELDSILTASIVVDL